MKTYDFHSGCNVQGVAPCVHPLHCGCALGLHCPLLGHEEAAFKAAAVWHSVACFPSRVDLFLCVEADSNIKEEEGFRPFSAAALCAYIL